MAGKPLEVEILVRRGGETIPYAALTEEEKCALAESLNRRAIRAVAALRGLEAEFWDAPQEKTETTD